MIMDMMLVTYAKDYPWLEWCLKSFVKFARGFSSIIILVPDEDVEEGVRRFGDKAGDIPICWRHAKEWEGKGMLWHEYQIFNADKWSDAEVIGHLDPDCVFTAPVTPDTYVVGCRPILRYEPYARLIQRVPGIKLWQEAAEACLPFKVDKEFMRAHPGVYHRELYAKCRALMEEKTGQSVEDYVKAGTNSFPQSIAEFPTLGAVAWECFRDKYLFIEQFNEVQTPDNHLIQTWSHGPIDQPQTIWIRGQYKTVVPLQLFKDIGL